MGRSSTSVESSRCRPPPSSGRVRLRAGTAAGLVSTRTSDRDPRLGAAGSSPFVPQNDQCLPEQAGDQDGAGYERDQEAPAITEQVR